MAYSITFDPKVKKIMGKWKKSNPVLFKSLVNLLTDIMEHPRTGKGRPEALVGGQDKIYSRRISGQHRIVYEIDDDTIIVFVIEIEGHYADK